MNLNGDEKKIRQLFSELSRDDRRRAPEFAGVMRAAYSGAAGAQRRNRSFVFAWAVAALCLAILVAVSFAVRHSKSRVPDAPTRAEVSPQPAEHPAEEVSAPRVGDARRTTERRILIKHIPRRRTSGELAIRMKSLSSWQSPTASLLKAPGEEIFKSLPRLGESLLSIKIFSPEEFN